MNLLKKQLILIYMIFLIIVIGSITHFKEYTPQTSGIFTSDNLDLRKPLFSGRDTYNDIEDVFDAKINEFNTLGYYQHIYKSSLQATYYALYILDSLDKLNNINVSVIEAYIMSLYNNSTHLFMDDYAYRYLDIDFSKQYYPLTSVLEINCYALLSLHTINRLDLINIPQMVNFILSCYNPQTSGFIGQPYSVELAENFKISTIDNTYYAILLIDLLSDWDLYPDKKNELIIYINSLQSYESQDSWNFGGFFNDNDNAFKSIGIYEPNLLASYYSIKSLEIFNMIETININNFHQYLTHLYDEDKSFFHLYGALYDNKTNLAATAIGLELSNLTQFSGIDSNAILDFLFNNRNSQGTWDTSIENTNYELIDTFQIIRTLQNIGALGQLTIIDKEKITVALELYHQNKGYSLISKEYMSLKLIHTIINSFNYHNRIADLPINYLYDIILDSSYYDLGIQYLRFIQILNYDNYHEIRSLPYEYFSIGNRNYITDQNLMYDHKSTYYSIDSLIKIYKLDDLESIYDLNELMSNIINSQFLEASYSNYGGFLPSIGLKDPLYSLEYQNTFVDICYTYYAFLCVEILSNFLNAQPVKELLLNLDALYSYISKNIVETPNKLYYNSGNTNNIDVILQETYFIIYILKSLDYFTLNEQKLKYFIEENVNYSDIENIYYCWKISQLLDVKISFDFSKTYELIQKIYSEEFKDFYSDINNIHIAQEVFSWVCEMAKEDNIDISAFLDNSVELGGYNNISVLLQNIILKEFGPDIVVKFESEQLGVYTLKKQIDSSFNEIIYIPYSSDNFPIIQANITVYSGITHIASKQVSFQTSGLSTNILENNEEDGDPSNQSKILYDKNIPTAIPLMITLIAIPSCVIIISTKMKATKRGNNSLFKLRKN